MINILIPVKAFKNSKNRLSNSLSNNQRITASKNLINRLSQNFIKLDQKVIIVTDDKDLKIKNMILITKSPKKVIGLDGYGIKITKQELI